MVLAAALAPACASLAALLTTAAPAAAIVDGTDATHAPRSVVALRVDLGDGRGGICAAVLVRDPRSGKIGAVTSAVCATAPGQRTPLPAAGLTVLAGSPSVTRATAIPVTGLTVPAGWAWGDGAPERPVQAWAVVRIPQTRGLSAMAIAAAPRPHQRVIQMGWGALHPTDTTQPDMLQQLPGRVIATSNCATAFAAADEFCVGSHTGSGIFRGDAGAPGLVYERGGWAVAGLVSRTTAETTGADLGPAVFTTLDVYRDAIYAAIRGDGSATPTAAPAAASATAAGGPSTTADAGPGGWALAG